MKKILFLLVLAGCQFEFKGEHFIQPEIQPYFEAFQNEAARLGVAIPDKAIMISMVDVVNKKNARGHCDWDNDMCNIKIRQSFYDDFASSGYSLDFEATIFHELAHGLFNRHHLDPGENDEFEESLMTIPQFTLRRYYVDGTMREYYLKELFGLN